MCLPLRLHHDVVELSLQGIKITLEDEYVPAVIDLDTHVLRLYWTSERLQQQSNILNTRAARLDIASRCNAFNTACLLP